MSKIAEARKITHAKITTFTVLLWEGCQSFAQQACYLPSLSQYPFIHLGWEEQVKVPCSKTQHTAQQGSNSQPGDIESGAELRMHKTSFKNCEINEKHVNIFFFFFFQVSTLNRDLSSNLTREITDMRIEITGLTINQTVKDDLLLLSNNLATYVEEAVTNVSRINIIVEDNTLDVGWFAGEVKNYEYFR